MKTKEDFLRSIRDNISQYPDAALRYQSGDPMLLASLEAVATMLAMGSQQMEIAMAEPFIKSRDATVLADAALKGILPMASPARLQLTLQNASNSSYTLAAGRRLLDPDGNYCSVESALTVAAGATGTLSVIQRTTTDVPFTVATSDPFYAFEVPQPTDGSYISGLTLTRDSDDAVFTYAQRYTNVLPGDLIYHVETDEYRRLFVKFGYDEVVGYQPGAGEAFTLTIHECRGEVSPSAGAPFTLEYVSTPQEAQLTFKMDSVLESGAKPVDVATLRELCKFPAIYDDAAVFLGEFSLLIRKALPDLQFLSVWNEQIEEKVRGESVDNINRLFIAFTEPVGDDYDTIKAQIEQIIDSADDSYSVSFVPVVVREINVAVEARVAVVHDPAVVESQVRAAVAAEYGPTAQATRGGMLVFKNVRLYDRLRKDVDALKDQPADLNVDILSDSTALLPENRLYVSDDSLEVRVVQLRENVGQWGI